jgi:AcrR family transcriptional regulator
MQKPRLAAKARREAIVKAALPLFARKGFAATTTKDLARAAGVSEPLLYRHFPSKEALYLEIQDSSCRTADPVLKTLAGLERSTSTLVRLIYCLMRGLILGKPAGFVDWETRQRLMLNSLLEDGTYARLLYQTRFESFCRQMELCLAAAIRAGEAVRTPVSKSNGARFAHHVGAWVASVSLPGKPVIEYAGSRDELLSEAVCFALRGMGLTDEAIARYYRPKALALLFEDN